MMYVLGVFYACGFGVMAWRSAQVLRDSELRKRMGVWMALLMACILWPLTALFMSYEHKRY